MVIPYFYFVLMIVLGIIPLVAFLILYPSFWYRFTTIAVYMAFVNFLHEISALGMNQWSFPGKNFIGWVEVLSYRLPLEEFLLWIMCSSMFVLAWYEYFVDDQR